MSLGWLGIGAVCSTCAAPLIVHSPPGGPSLRVGFSANCLLEMGVGAMGSNIEVACRRLSKEGLTTESPASMFLLRLEDCDDVSSDERLLFVAEREDEESLSCSGGRFGSDEG